MDSSQAKLGLVANTAREPRDSSRNLGLIARESRAVSQAKLGIHHERNLGFITNETWNSPQTKLGIHHKRHFGFLTNKTWESSPAKLGIRRKRNLHQMFFKSVQQQRQHSNNSAAITASPYFPHIHPVCPEALSVLP